MLVPEERAYPDNSPIKARPRSAKPRRERPAGASQAIGLLGNANFWTSLSMRAKQAPAKISWTSSEAWKQNSLALQTLLESIFDT